MRRGDEDLLDEVVVGGHGAGLALSAALLRAVERDRVALHVAGVAHGDDHVLVRDQVLVGQIARLPKDLRTPGVAEVALHLAQLVLDDGEQELLAAQDGRQARDERLHLGQLVEDLLLLQAGEALQLHLQDGLRLDLGEREERLQLSRGDLPVLRGLDDRDDLIDVVERDLVPEQDVLALLRLAQLVARAAGDHVAAVGDEPLEQRLEPQRARLAPVDAQHGRAESVLEERAVLVQVVQHYPGDRVALGLHHRADALAGGLVAQVADPLQLLVLDQLGDGLDGARLVDLIRHFRNHDGVAAGLLVGLDLHLGAQLEDAAARLVQRADGAHPHEDAAGGEVGPLDAARQRPSQLGIEQIAQRRVGMIDEVDGALDRLAQVVRRDVRRHAHRDPRRAVHQEIRKPRRQHQGFGGGVVEVRAELDGLLVDVGEHRLGQPGEARLGVAVGRRAVAVDRAEVALPVDQRRAQVPLLRQAHQRVVDRGIAVRVVTLQDFAHRAGALRVAPVVQHSLLEHRVEDAAVDGLQAVAHVGQRAPDDHRHRIVEIRLPHLVFDGDGNERGSGLRHAFLPAFWLRREAVLYPVRRCAATTFSPNA